MGRGVEPPHRELVGGEGVGTAQKRLLFEVFLHLCFLQAIIFTIELLYAVF